MAGLPGTPILFQDMPILLATSLWDDGKTLLLTGGVATTVVLLLLIGLWTKFLEPLVRKTVEAWYNDPARQEQREKFAKKVIENEVQRIDGLIYTHTTAHTNMTNEGWRTAYNELRLEMAEDRKLLHEMVAKLGRLEGMLAMIAKHQRISIPEMPAVSPPPVSGVALKR